MAATATATKTPAGRKRSAPSAPPATEATPARRMLPVYEQDDPRLVRRLMAHRPLPIAPEERRQHAVDYARLARRQAEWAGDPGYEKTLPSAMMRATMGPNGFLHSVNGKSVEGRGVLDGDVILINPDVEAKDGDVVCVEAFGIGKRFGLVKIYRCDGVTSWLESQPAGPDSVGRLECDDFIVIGVIVGKFRPKAATQGAAS